jgi:hypothetical protein
MVPSAAAVAATAAAAAGRCNYRVIIVPSWQKRFVRPIAVIKILASTFSVAKCNVTIPALMNSCN